MPRRTEKYNLKVINPALAKQWHPTKNGTLRPEAVTPWSAKKVWWICDKGHEWQAQVEARQNGTGCPFCRRFRASKEHNLQVKNPKVAAQWHPTKNGKLTAKDVAPNSGRKVWWVCAEGHEWEATVSDRNNGRGCPFCAGLRASEDYCLATVNPELAAQWHPTRNGTLTPKDVTPGSAKKVWWICQKGHEFEARINNRNRRVGCPRCNSQVATETYNLMTIRPDIAAQWHPQKNGELSPKDVSPSSQKKVWWICDKGHEYQATIANRSKGRGCPYCAGRLVCEDNCLQTINPSVAAQWHPSKNDGLTPKDVVPGSERKVWWMCSEGHEWEAIIHSRNRGSGCPYCSGYKKQSHVSGITKKAGR